MEETYKLFVHHSEELHIIGSEEEMLTVKNALLASNQLCWGIYIN